MGGVSRVAAVLLLLASGCGDTFVSSSTSGAGGAGGGGEGGTPFTTSPASGSATAGGSCDALWFCDQDLDGWGDDNESVMSCDQPPPGVEGCAGPWIGSGEDCAPADERAHPTQESYENTAIAPPLYVESYFDFDCNRVVEKNPAQLFNQDGVVSCQPSDCPAQTTGFSTAAECGSTTNHYTCTLDSFSVCVPTEVAPAEALGCR